jgi:hypothetical protein
MLHFFAYHPFHKSFISEFTSLFSPLYIGG